jgi:hypothetical protein
MTPDAPRRPRPIGTSVVVAPFATSGGCGSVSECSRAELAHCFVMRRRQVLEFWMSRYGLLSPASQERFLRRQETTRLARYPDDIIRKAIRWSNLLSDALSFAHSAYEGDARAWPPEPQAPSRPVRTSTVSEALRQRDPGLDRRLAAKIGPVQRYEDNF